jgi:hypothetical protein
LRRARTICDAGRAHAAVIHTRALRPRWSRHRRRRRLVANGPLAHAAHTLPCNVAPESKTSSPTSVELASLFSGKWDSNRGWAHGGLWPLPHGVVRTALGKLSDTHNERVGIGSHERRAARTADGFQEQLSLGIAPDASTAPRSSTPSLKRSFSLPTQKIKPVPREHGRYAPAWAWCDAGWWKRQRARLGQTPVAANGWHTSVCLLTQSKPAAQ